MCVYGTHTMVTEAVDDGPNTASEFSRGYFAALCNMSPFPISRISCMLVYRGLKRFCPSISFIGGKLLSSPPPLNKNTQDSKYCVHPA